MNPPVCHSEVELSGLHTFGLDAKATGLRHIRNQLDLMEYAEARKAGLTAILLGEGSNTVFVSPRVDATIWQVGLKGREYLGTQDGQHIFRLGAGENWHNWVEWSVAAGFPGLENLALIPGAVGASPIQNIGAYGVEVKDRIAAVHVFDWQDSSLQVMSAQECEFAYRESIFKQGLSGKVVITAVDFALPVRWEPMLEYGDIQMRCNALGGINPQNVMKAVIQTRTEKLPDPAVLGNSGSFFKNPVVSAGQAQQLADRFEGMPQFKAEGGRVKLAAGWLIDQAGLKGHRVGGIQVYPKQALILTNTGGGTGSHLTQMIKVIQQTVHERFGVALEPEPNLIA